MPAGRPPELGSDGKPIAKCLVNCTIPTKLRDFLVENKVNRSELFRTAALRMYEMKICPRCYSDNINDTYKGKYCLDCMDRGKHSWLMFKTCKKCGDTWRPDLNGLMFNDEIICQTCYDKEVHDTDQFITDELMKKSLEP